MRTRIIRIGNSQGVRIPKPLLEQIGLDWGNGAVELDVQQDRIVIQAAQRPRQGWDEQFARMAERCDDRLLDGEAHPLRGWDADEWEW